MADYYSQTVVQPNIPIDAITPLEIALLTGMYEHESDGDAFYFFSSEGPSDMVWLDIVELREMLADEIITPGSIAAIVREKLDDAGPEETELEIDLSDLGDATIFQGIVSRCDELDHVTITSGWTCSKMRPDGFGGGVTVVTADRILSSSTNEMEGRLLDQCEYGELGRAPGHGSHVLLRLDEADVRQEVIAIAEVASPPGADPSSVTDEDIRVACLKTVEATDLAVQHDAIAAIAARAAIAIAAQRTS